jgi:hypothetical protein
VPLLSMIRVLTPSLLIQFAVISPAGPAPTMRTSTALLSIVVAPILFFLCSVAVWFECLAWRPVWFEVVHSMSDRWLYICGGVVHGKRAGLHLAAYRVGLSHLSYRDDSIIHLTVGYMS